MGLLSLAVGGQAESMRAAPQLWHTGMKGMDEVKPFLAAAIGDVTRGSGPRLQPRGVQVGFGESFFPKTGPQGSGRCSSEPSQAPACIVWAGTQGPKVPRNGCLAQHQDTGNDHPSSLGAADPKCPGLACRATVPPGSCCCQADAPSPSHHAACCKLEVEKIPPK